MNGVRIVEKFKEFFKKNERYLAIGFLAVIIVIVISYALSIKQKQTKETTYEIYTVKKTAPYQGKGTVKNNSTYVARVPKDAQLTTTLQPEQAVKKGQQLGTLNFPEKQTELKQVQAKIADLQNQIQTQQTNATSQSSNEYETGSSFTSSSVSPVSGDPTQSESEATDNEAAQQQIQALQDTLAQSKQEAAQEKLSSLQAELSEQQAKADELSSQVESQETAPFDGIFQLKELKNGTRELRVYAADKVLEARVAQDDYSQVEAGKKIKLKNSVVDTTPESKISFVSKLPLKQAGTDKPAYKFSAPVDKSFLKGQVVHFKVPQPGSQIPLSSVKNNQVYLVQGDKTAHTVEVKGRKLGKSFIVSDGLKKGDKIIVHPNKHLHDDVKIHEK